MLSTLGKSPRCITAGAFGNMEPDNEVKRRDDDRIVILERPGQSTTVLSM